MPVSLPSGVRQKQHKGVKTGTYLQAFLSPTAQVSSGLDFNLTVCSHSSRGKLFRFAPREVNVLAVLCILSTGE